MKGRVMPGNLPAPPADPSRSTSVRLVIRRSFRVGLTLGLLAGLAFAVFKMLSGRNGVAVEPTPVPGEPWPPLRPDVEPPAAPVSTTAPVASTPAVEPSTAAETPTAETPTADEPTATPAAPVAAAETPAAPKKAAKKAAPARAWVEPKGGVCPTSHPVKAKLTSKIFHLPGMLNYERTNPDRCYRDADAAEADGLRAAKR